VNGGGGEGAAGDADDDEVGDSGADSGGPPQLPLLLFRPVPYGCRVKDRDRAQRWSARRDEAATVAEAPVQWATRRIVFLCFGCFPSLSLPEGVIKKHKKIGRGCVGGLPNARLGAEDDEEQIALIQI
jgi:hypothetical protein